MSISGWIVLDKSEGVSSNKAMCEIRRLLGEKTGYVGTLDPFAQGILPIAVGEARKFIPYVNDSKKEYTFRIKFGEATDTLDRCGKVTQSGGRQPTDSELDHITQQFLGDILQVPPIYSAIKINGCRAYRLAVSNQNVEIAPRKVSIHSLRYLGNNTFRCTCSRGTYIRSLVRDMCEYLGTYGHATFLRREKVSFLNSECSITIENVKKSVYNGQVDDMLLPIESALNDISAVTLSDEHVIRLQNGLYRYLDISLVNDQMYKVFKESSGAFCGLAMAYGGNCLMPVRMCSL